MKRAKFSLSNRKLFTCDMGELVPCGLLEVLPGDSIQAATSMLVRTQPMLAPPMHPVDVRIHHWFVPHRLVWSDWENFITGGPDGLNASVFPTITLAGGAAVGSLADYLGVPTGVAGISVSALPFRGYSLIWNSWYRDQDLETALVVNTAAGADATTNTTLQCCDWEKDYYTSARPWEQKGPGITIPLGTRAEIRGIGFEPSSVATGPTKVGVREGGGNHQDYPYWFASPTQNILVKALGTTNADHPDLYTDLSTATAASINTLRQAFALQRYEEARARYGSRYTEYLRYLGVRSSDARLQRPEYLGGGRDTIQFSEVLQTAADGANAVGTMRGHGIAGVRSNRFRRFFEEHGYMFTLMSVRPKTMYIQGIPRTWNRRAKEDFWQVELQHIGQQKVLNKELYAAHSTPEGTFGYQDRYDEYRRQESFVSGEFRSSLNMWHFARSFASDPALNASFVKCVPPENTFAVPASDVLWVLARNSIQARRLVSPSGSSFIY